MTGDKMREVLISPVLGYKQSQEEGSWSILKTLGITALLILVALSAVRYESKIGQLEARLEILETESIIKETLGLQVKVSDLMGGEVNFINPSEKTKELPRQKREANPRPPSHQIVRNEQDETFFTRGRQGGYVRPSGVREMWERLPPMSGEVGYQSPPIDYSQQQVQTRAAPASGQAYVPPVQRVGYGADQVSARVIRYRENDSDPSPITSSAATSTVAGHFVADVSNFTSSDNPRLRNANGIFQIWRPASWMSTGNFLMDSKDGVVTVQKAGIFHVYAQIHYHDEQQNSFVVEVNGIPLLQCTTTTQNGSCFTAGLTELKRGDRIVIKNVGVDRFSIYKPEKSFFGLVKVGN